MGESVHTTELRSLREGGEDTEDGYEILHKSQILLDLIRTFREILIHPFKISRLRQLAVTRD